MKLKCPVCDSVIQFDKSDSKIKCQLCESVFKKDKILAIYQSKSLLKSSKANQQTVNDENKTAPPSKPKTERKNILNEKSKADVDWTQAGSDIAPEKPSEKINEITSATVIQKAKKSKQNLYLLLGFFLIAISLIVAIIWALQKNQPNPSLTSDHEAIADEPSEPANQSDNDMAAKRQSDEANSATAAKQPPPQLLKPFAELDGQGQIGKSFPKPTNLFKAKKTMDKCWFNAKPYLLELFADTPTGRKTATGIIVDSRGWVVTSYNTFKDAREINLRRAVDINQTDEQRVLDTARGFIAVMPQHDLALLAINRRLIDTFEDLPLSQDDLKLVASQYVIQIQPPCKLYPYAMEETQIRQTATIPELDPLIAKRLDFRGFDTQVRWLRHDNLAPMKIGAPLLDDMGNVMAMNTAAFDSTSKQTIAVPAKYIIELKNSATDKVLPLPILGDNAFQNDVPASTPVVAIDADSRSLSENLNRLGEQCQAFSWWAETDDEKSSFRQFIETFVEARHAVDRDNGSDAEIETLEEQVEKWQTEIADNLGNNRSPTSAAQDKFNQEFAGDFTPGKPFAAFVFISHAAINLQQIAIGNQSQPADAVGFEIKGLTKKMIANVEPSWAPMPVDSPWLIIGKEIPGVVTVNDRSGNQESLRAAEIHFVFESNAP